MLGRVLAEGFIPAWAERTANPDAEEAEFARKMNDTHRVVFSRTLQESKWENVAP